MTVPTVQDTDPFFPFFRTTLMNYEDFRGVFPPMVTPFTEDGRVDYDAFVFNIDKWNSTGLSGYLVMGSNSETTFLTEAEKLELIRLTVETAAPEKRIIVGTGLESIADTIRLTNRAARLGAQCALLLTPYFYGYEMTSAALESYYRETADHCDIPVLIYNVPKFTHVNIQADAVRELARHPNIIGMKDSAGDVAQLATFLRETPDDFSIAVGTASVWYPALTLGIRTGVHALANCCPDDDVAVQTAYEKGDRETALKTYQRLFPVNAVVTGSLGVAALKYACDLMGYRGGYVRKPLQPVTEDQKKMIRSVLEQARVLP